MCMGNKCDAPISVLTWGSGGTTGVEGQRDGKFWEGKWSCVCSVGKRNMCIGACSCRCTCTYRCHNVHSSLNTCTCMCSSVHSCGCVADGRDTMVLDFCVQTASG